MKTLLGSLAAMGALLLAACQTYTPVNSPEAASFPRIRPNETIQVAVDVTGIGRNGDNDLDRFAYFSEAVEQAFKESGIPNKVTVSRWPVNASDDVPVLYLSLDRWRSLPPGMELEATVEGSLHKGGKNLDLGIARETGIVPATGTAFIDQHINAYKDVAQKAVSVLLARMQPFVQR